MALQLREQWVWDFWHVEAGGDHHLFYLQAPRALGDPELRHWSVSIGHAVSDDLMRWSVLPDALVPGAPGRWDDYMTWTGSVVEHGGRWCMLYTGTSTAEDGLVQRIGLATSDDLITWERHSDRPVLEADPEWYELLDLSAWHDQAWRDPWVWRDPGDGSFHAYVTTRSRSGEPSGRGVIGHARSRDLESWEVFPPVTEPMGFGQMEVPQLIETGARSYLLFCGEIARKSQSTLTGTFYVAAETAAGTFSADTVRVLEADSLGRSYAGKLIDSSRGLQFLAWERGLEPGAFAGTISDPRPVLLAADGSLVVDRSNEQDVAMASADA